MAAYQTNKVEIVWKCCEKAFTQHEITVHLEEAHELKPPLVGSRRLVQHFDGKKWYQSVFEWELGTVILQQSIMCKRSKRDQKLWE